MSRYRKLMKDENSKDRDHLLTFNRERIEHFIIAHKGPDKPAIFVLDISGKTTRDFAKKIGGSKFDLESFPAAKCPKGTTPTVFMAMPMEQAFVSLQILLSAESFKTISEVNFDGKFLAVALDDQGVQVQVWPIPE